MSLALAFAAAIVVVTVTDPEVLAEIEALASELERRGMLLQDGDGAADTGES